METDNRPSRAGRLPASRGMPMSSEVTQAGEQIVRTLFPAVEPPPPPPVPGFEQWFTYVDLATMLRVKVNTLHVWVRQGRIPAPVPFGGVVRFSLDQVTQILQGVKPKGSFANEPSPKAVARKNAVKQKATTPAQPVNTHVPMPFTADTDPPPPPPPPVTSVPIAEEEKPRWVRELELDEKPAKKKPAKKPTGKKPATSRTSTKKPATSRTSTKKPATSRTSTKKPTAKEGGKRRAN